MWGQRKMSWNYFLFFFFYQKLPVNWRLLSNRQATELCSGVFTCCRMADRSFEALWRLLRSSSSESCWHSGGTRNKFNGKQSKPRGGKSCWETVSYECQEFGRKGFQVSCELLKNKRTFSKGRTAETLSSHTLSQSQQPHMSKENLI